MLTQAQAPLFSDDLGQPAQLARAPQRIVSLLPSLAETVCALGACHRLVGVDRYTNFPAQLQALPRVGGGLDPNIEAIVALRPDLVLLAGSTRGVERLRALGLTVQVFEPRSHADVQRTVFALGQLLQVDTAASLWQAIEAELQQAARSVPASARGAKVYFEVSSMPHAAGEASFIGETLQRLGVRNIVPASLGPFPQLNPEFVVRAGPDLLMLGERPETPLHARPGWAALPALAQGRVCRYSTAQADVLLRPGPRMGQAARFMAACLVQHARRPDPPSGLASDARPGARPDPVASQRP